MAAVATPLKPEQLVVLDDVSWETYERLLAENNPGRGKRFTYDNGALQIMVLSFRHELPNRLLATIAYEVATEWRVSIISAGSITVKRPDLYKGFEPDSSLYIRSAAAVRGKRVLDFTVDPPPDLVIEVDITRDSMNKFPIFAAVGIPEVWRYDGKLVTIHVARNGRYVEEETSEALAPLSGELLNAFLSAGLEDETVEWVFRLRKWAREARPSGH